MEGMRAGVVARRIDPLTMEGHCVAGVKVLGRSLASALSRLQLLLTHPTTKPTSEQKRGRRRWLSASNLNRVVGGVVDSRRSTPHAAQNLDAFTWRCVAMCAGEQQGLALAIAAARSQSSREGDRLEREPRTERCSLACTWLQSCLVLQPRQSNQRGDGRLEERLISRRKAAHSSAFCRPPPSWSMIRRSASVFESAGSPSCWTTSMRTRRFAPWFHALAVCTAMHHARIFVKLLHGAACKQASGGGLSLWFCIHLSLMEHGLAGTQPLPCKEVPFSGSKELLDGVLVQSRRIQRCCQSQSTRLHPQMANSSQLPRRPIPTQPTRPNKALAQFKLYCKHEPAW